MPQITLTKRAQIDLERLRAFLASNSPTASKKSAKVLKNALELISRQPRIGKAYTEPNQFDLIINFGTSGYIIRYELQQELILILAVRHQREVGF